MKLLSTKQSWIPREYHGEVVRRLLDFGLLKFDNARHLPLVGGGKTDIYVNLRDARDKPEAISFLAELFMEPLRRLNVQRFVEVPDSVSCFAGPLSVASNLPYLTIRSEAKEGRVANAKVIGHAVKGERVCLIDDVITDGASKASPYKECLDLGLDVMALVVLVDRQHYWRSNPCLGGLEVWAGMTLHDVRRELINMGAMKQCDEGIKERNPIIVALDGKSWDEILPIVDQLRTTGCILKVNDLLFAEGMDHLLPELSVYGRVMVDLKCHETPNTVENTCRRLAKHNVWAVTVHASGGREMVRRAKQAVHPNTKVLAVTVLTSLDDDDCMMIYSKNSAETVVRLAIEADNCLAGLDGFVCSPKEVVELKKLILCDKIIVTPGVRSDENPSDDQARIATPKQAIENGAHHIVMGRQILNAINPVAEVKRVLVEELGIEELGIWLPVSS